MLTTYEKDLMISIVNVCQDELLAQYCRDGQIPVPRYSELEEIKTKLINLINEN